MQALRDAKEKLVGLGGGSEASLGFNSRMSGLKVLQSPHALRETETPVKKHSWDGKKETLKYHKRIQKKWVKRFGMVMKPCIYETPFGFVCHPEIYQKLAREECN